MPCYYITVLKQFQVIFTKNYNFFLLLLIFDFLLIIIQFIFLLILLLFLFALYYYCVGLFYRIFTIYHSLISLFLHAWNLWHFIFFRSFLWKIKINLPLAASILLYRFIQCLLFWLFVWLLRQFFSGAQLLLLSTTCFQPFRHSSLVFWLRF